ncbi:multiple organellar RNA editing factor 8, chloroplastic/mitochondrial-like [Impatiens glandulifera]|uniref:multiple organellar RNA editing factor 8, chloroplastic/mitochondrial-like n=1 Tax=Impatiens glandulifera TaxID=253017 RepID=UPI001FB1688C|nr:multiple organellar RNA editing factor 8, chloroplastic/mitochondrial-like [Impatiens glandulifera]
MATSFIRSFLTTQRTERLVLCRFYSSTSFPSRPSSVSTIYTSFLVRYRPLVAVPFNFNRISSSPFRSFSTRQTSSSISDPNPNWSNRPPKETILLDGCDFEHWLVVMEKPEGDPTRDEIIHSYIKTLAMVVGSEDEARMKLYSVSTRHYFAFGALVSEELSYKIKELPGVRWVLPDSYLDVRNKDYGGEPVIDGNAVPYDPKYHEEWVRNNARANERNRRNDRPRNFDRSRNFDRNRQNMSHNMGGGGGAPPNMSSPGNNMGGAPPPNNMSGPPQFNIGQTGPNNTGGGMPPNNIGQTGPHYTGGGMPSNNQQNGQYRNGPNYGGMPPPQNRDYQQQPNNNYVPNRSDGNNQYQQQQPNYVHNRPPQEGNQYNQHQPNFVANRSEGNQYNNHQQQNVPGRDGPPTNYQ